MKQFKKEVFIHLQKEYYQTEYSTHFFTSDMSDYGYILIGKSLVNVEMPSNDIITELHIKSLRNKEQKLKADFQVAKQGIEDEIQSLLSIGFTPVEEDVFA